MPGRLAPPSHRMRRILLAAVGGASLAALAIIWGFLHAGLWHPTWGAPVSFRSLLLKLHLAPPKTARIVAPPRPTVPSDSSAAEQFNVRGVELAQSGNLDAAITQFRQALSLDPRNYKAHNNLGVLYKRKGLVAEAIREYRSALGSDPGNPIPYKNLAILLEKQSSLAEALENYRHYLKLAPDASDAKLIRARVQELQSKLQGAAGNRPPG